MTMKTMEMKDKNKKKKKKKKKQIEAPAVLDGQNRQQHRNQHQGIFAIALAV